MVSMSFLEESLQLQNTQLILLCLVMKIQPEIARRKLMQVSNVCAVDNVFYLVVHKTSHVMTRT